MIESLVACQQCPPELLPTSVRPTPEEVCSVDGCDLVRGHMPVEVHASVSLSGVVVKVWEPVSPVRRRALERLARAEDDVFGVLEEARLMASGLRQEFAADPVMLHVLSMFERALPFDSYTTLFDPDVEREAAFVSVLEDVSVMLKRREKKAAG